MSAGRADVSTCPRMVDLYTSVGAARRLEEDGRRDGVFGPNSAHQPRAQNPQHHFRAKVARGKCEEGGLYSVVVGFATIAHSLRYDLLTKPTDKSSLGGGPTSGLGHVR